MRKKTLLIILTATILLAFSSYSSDKTPSQIGRFNVEKDLLLVQLDCKTDVDDLQTAAGLATLMSNSEFSEINYHVVTGAYGIQGGLYLSPNSLLELAFKNNWTDAHENFEGAIVQVKVFVKATLENEGDIWIAEAGQSDFSAALVKTIQSDLANVNTSKRIHIVQHSRWNEENTSPENLEFVKKNTDYKKITDGNAVGNGTPGFRSPEYTQWRDKIKNLKLIEIWQHSIDLCNKYNGKEGRYNNEAIARGWIRFF